MSVGRSPVLGLAASIAVAGLAVALPGDDEAPQDTAVRQTVSLKYRALKNFDSVLPRETWTNVTDRIAIGDGFDVHQQGPLKLRVDTNGDGKLDADVKGNSGYLRLVGKTDDGETFAYGTRFKITGDHYSFAASGAMCGKLNGISIQVIDQNNNGIYNDFGQDALVVGRAKGATFLSRVVNADGELFQIELSEDGSELSYEPFEGETATLDMTGSHDSRGKLVSAVISNRGGEHHFNVARERGAMQVPAGDYRFVFGFLKKGEETAQVRTGKMGPLKLAAGSEREVEWGGPVVAEFDYDVRDETITVRPNVAFYGSAGEEYHTFKPDAKSPKIIVSDKKSRKIYLEGRFGGC
ncbi:MAG: hypothetical protein GY711_10090 [bacterium]|nr:hypothetical protein [bacterium]